MFGIKTDLTEQAAACRTLVKFCEDHRLEDAKALNLIRTSLTQHESGDFAKAKASFDQIWLGKEGLYDWWPAALEGENREYVRTIFLALMERWIRLMSHK